MSPSSHRTANKPLARVLFTDSDDADAEYLPVSKRRRFSPSSSAASDATGEALSGSSRGTEVSSVGVSRSSRFTDRSQVVLVTRNLRVRCDTTSADSAASCQPLLWDAGRQLSAASDAASATPRAQQTMAASQHPTPPEQHCGQQAASPFASPSADAVRPFGVSANGALDAKDEMAAFARWSKEVQSSPDGNPLQRPPSFLPELSLAGETAMPLSCQVARALMPIPEDAFPVERVAAELCSLTSMLDVVRAAEQKRRLAK